MEEEKQGIKARTRLRVVQYSEAERWESHRDHSYMGAGSYENKHGVGIILNMKGDRKIQWTEDISERAIATLIDINKKKVMLMSVYFPHTGYADHHVEKITNPSRSV